MKVKQNLEDSPSGWQSSLFKFLFLWSENDSETKPCGLSLRMVEQSHPTLPISKDDIAHPLTNLGKGNKSYICNEITNPLTNLEKQTSDGCQPWVIIWPNAWWQFDAVFVENDGVDHIFLKFKSNLVTKVKATADISKNINFNRFASYLLVIRWMRCRSQKRTGIFAWLSFSEELKSWY